MAKQPSEILQWSFSFLPYYPACRCYIPSLLLPLFWALLLFFFLLDFPFSFGMLWGSILITALTLCSITFFLSILCLHVYRSKTLNQQFFGSPFFSTLQYGKVRCSLMLINNNGNTVIKAAKNTPRPTKPFDVPPLKNWNGTTFSR